MKKWLCLILFSISMLGCAPPADDGSKGADSDSNVTVVEPDGNSASV